MRKPGKRAFRAWYNVMALLASLFVCLFHRPVFSGKDNLPDGPMILCPNHTKWYDPILVGRALWPGRTLRYMSKAELFRSRFLSFFLYRMGLFPVNRGTSDVSALKTAVDFLKDGEAILVFPEGTRTQTDGQVRPKAGAVKIAQWSGAPLVPVYLPKQRRFLGPIPVIIGEPYFPDEKTAGHTEQAQDLMDRIYALRQVI